MKSNLTLLMLVLSATVTTAAPPSVDLHIKDLTPKFLQFYGQARQEHAEEAQRWKLWKKLVDFAAVPPTPEGDQMARKMLDSAWSRYPSIVPQIKEGAAGIHPAPSTIVNSVAALMQADVPIRVNLVVFVGAFENNAFTAPGAENVPTVAVPIEARERDRLLANSPTSLKRSKRIFHWVGNVLLPTQFLSKGWPCEPRRSSIRDWLRRITSVRRVPAGSRKPRDGSSRLSGMLSRI